MYAKCFGHVSICTEPNCSGCLDEGGLLKIANYYETRLLFQSKKKNAFNNQSTQKKSLNQKVEVLVSQLNRRLFFGLVACQNVSPVC